MTIVGFPKVDSLIGYHRRMVEVLEATGRNLHPVLSARSGNFLNTTPDEFYAALHDVRDELDAQTTMMLIASAEATLKRDCKRRLASKARREPLWRELDTLWKQEEAAGHRGVRTAKLLGVWKTISGAPLKGLLKLFQHRNWLAHGRFYTDKSGVVADPEQVVFVIKDSFARLTAYRSDFPLD